MMISSKGRYALRVMVFLAEHNSDEYVPLKEISEKEQISQKYLESIARMLSKEHLIEGISGHGGGYRLARKPEDYRISEILRLTEGTLAPAYRTMQCPATGQVTAVHCQSGKGWRSLWINILTA